MPDGSNSSGPAKAEPPAVPVEKAAQPLSESQLRAKRLEAAAKENDDECSERRAKELAVHLDAHFENVDAAHDKYPAPVGRYDEQGRTFEDWPEQVQKNWNARRKDIDMSNRAYHLAVRRTFAEHQAEDR